MMTDKQKTNQRFMVLVGLVVLLLTWWVRLVHFNELRVIFPDFLENKPFCGLDANAYQTYALDILTVAAKVTYKNIMTTYL
jgi:hypothetical protein